MKYLLFCFFLISYIPAQSQHIELTKLETGKITSIKQGQRVRVRTEDGQKIFGRINIIDSATIVLRNDTLRLQDVKKIQRRSATKAVVTAFMIAGGISATASAPILALVSTPTAAIATFAAGTALVISGILLPVVGNNHNRERWDYKIVTD